MCALVGEIAFWLGVGIFWQESWAESGTVGWRVLLPPSLGSYGGRGGSRTRGPGFPAGTELDAGLPCGWVGYSLGGVVGLKLIQFNFFIFYAGGTASGLCG